MRKPGWYWVKFGKGNDWECKRLVSNGYWASHDGVMETEPSEIGPRIPTPDDPWQCVPVETTYEMGEASGCIGYFGKSAYDQAQDMWSAMLAAAPRP